MEIFRNGTTTQKILSPENRPIENSDGSFNIYDETNSQTAVTDDQINRFMTGEDGVDSDQEPLMPRN